MASAMFTWITPEKTGETDRKEANTVGVDAPSFQSSPRYLK